MLVVANIMKRTFKVNRIIILFFDFCFIDFHFIIKINDLKIVKRIFNICFILYKQNLNSLFYEF